MKHEEAPAVRRIRNLVALGFVASIPVSLMGMQVFGIIGLILFFVALGRGELRAMPLDVAVGIYLAALGAGWLPVAGLPLDPLRMSGIWPVAAYGLFRVAGGDLARLGRWRLFWLVPAAAVGLYAAVQATVGLDLLALDGSRFYPSPANPERMAVMGFFNRHHTLGISAAMGLAVLLASRPFDAARRETVLSLLPLAVTVLLSQSRAAVGAAALAVVLFSVLRGRGREAGAVVLVLLLAGSLALWLEPALWGRVTTLWDASHDASRLDIWRVSVALAGSQDGWGFGRFFLQSQGVFDQLAPSVWVRSGTHMDILSAWVDGGLLLAAAWAGLWATAAVTAWHRRTHPVALGCAAGLCVLWIAGFSHNVMVDGELSWPLWALTGFLAALDGDDTPPPGA